MPDDEDTRLAVLREYRILDTDPEDAYDDITRLAAFICGTPIAAVSLIDAERQWFKSILGLAATETPRDAAFCAHTILQPGLMIIPDATEDPRFADNPLVTGDPNIRFYAGAPLVNESGYALGSLCVIDREPRHLTPDQEAALRTLARQVTNQLDLARRVAVQDRLIAEREQAEEGRRLLEGAVASAVEGIVVADAHQRDMPILYANPAFLSLTGYAEEEVFGRNCRFLQGKDTDPAAVRRIHDALHAGSGCRVTLLNYRKDGSPFWNELTIAPILNAAGALTHFVGIQHDITALHEAEAAIRQSEARLGLALESGRLGVWRRDLATGEFLDISDIGKANFGLPPEADVHQADFFQAIHADDLAHVQEAIHKTLTAGQVYQAEYRIIWPDGSVHWISANGTPVDGETGEAGYLIGITQDITRRKLLEAEREYVLQEALERADHDPLTGLFNHRVFHSRLNAETARAERENTAFAVVMLDIDNFKFFNDVYGHAVGDQVLRLVAGRMRAICRSYDTLARFGGDEFALILPHVGHATAGEIEARLCADLGGLFYRADEGQAAIPVSVSLGAALCSEAGMDCHEVLRQADERLLWSKTGGRTEETARRIRTDAGSRVQGFSMLDALVTAVDNKDRYTRRHSEDVMEYSLMIMRELGMDEGEQHTVAVAALLHDVGKIGVPDAILRKPGNLTDAEFEAVKQHPMMGAVMVGAVPGLEGTLDAVRHHHERWDGEGYPFGLRGEETPLIPRLMAVADAYSAMTTDRPYRKGMDRAKALRILEGGSGTQWDPQCVSAFLAVMRNAEGKMPFAPAEVSAA